MVACGCREKGGILRRVKVKGVVGLGVCLIASIAVVLLKGLYGGCAVVGDGEEVKGRGREGETRDAPLLDFPCKSQPRLCAVIMRKGVAGEIPESGPGVIPLMGGDDSLPSSGGITRIRNGKAPMKTKKKKKKGQQGEESDRGENMEIRKERLVYFLQVGNKNPNQELMKMTFVNFNNGLDDTKERDLHWLSAKQGKQLLHAGMRSSPGNGGEGIISSSPQNLNQLLCLVNDRTASAIWDADLPAFKVSCGSEGNDNFLWVPDGNMELYGGMDFTIGRSTPGFMDAVKVQSSIVVEEVSLGLVDMVEVGDVLKRNFPYAKKINIYVWEVEKKLRIRANLLDGLEHLQELSITFKSYYMGEENRNIFVNPGNTLSIGSYSSTTNYKGKSVEVSFVPDILHGVNQKKLKVFYFNAVHANLSSWSLSGCASLEDVHIQAYSLPLPSASSRSPLSLFASSCPRKVRLIYRDPTYLERLCNVSLESPMYMRNQGVVFPNCSGTFSREHPWDIQIYPDDGFLGNISTISDISRCANIASVPPGRYSKLRWGGLKFSKELVESFRGVDAETLCFSPVAFSGSFPDMERNEWSFKALHIHLYLSLKDSESKQNGIGGSLYEWAPFNALFTPETKKIMFYVDNDPVGNRFFISTDGLNETFRNSLDEIRFEHLNYKHFSILRVLQIFKRLVGISLHGMDINLAGMFNGTICAYANGTKCVLPAKYTLKSLNATITRPDDLKNTTVLHLVSLHQYPNLAHIYLNNIPVKFDDKLTNLGKISTFKFVNCGLDYIPEQSMSEDLVYFDVSSNRLKGLPSRLYKHDADSKLLTLVVRNNLIDEFSNSILPIPACSTTQDMACKGLQLLDISLNYISNIYVDLYKYFYVLFSSPTGVLNCIVLNVSHNLIDDLKVANDIPPIGKELVNNTGRNFTPMYEKLASKFNRSTSAEGRELMYEATGCFYCIDVSHNNLNVLHRGAFENIASLRSVIVSSNNLTKIEPGFVSGSSCVSFGCFADFSRNRLGTQYAEFEEAMASHLNSYETPFRLFDMRYNDFSVFPEILTSFLLKWNAIRDHSRIFLNENDRRTLFINMAHNNIARVDRICSKEVIERSKMGDFTIFVDLSFNNIRHISADALYCGDVKVALNLNNNPLEQLPELNRATGLFAVSAQNTSIRTIPKSWVALGLNGDKQYALLLQSLSITGKMKWDCCLGRKMIISHPRTLLSIDLGSFMPDVASLTPLDIEKSDLLRPGMYSYIERHLRLPKRGAAGHRFDSTICDYYGLTVTSAIVPAIHQEYTLCDFESLERSGFVECPLDAEKSDAFDGSTLTFTAVALLTLYVLYVIMAVYRCSIWLSIWIESAGTWDTSLVMRLRHYSVEHDESYVACESFEDSQFQGSRTASDYEVFPVIGFNKDCRRSVIYPGEYYAQPFGEIRYYKYIYMMDHSRKIQSIFNE